MSAEYMFSRVLRGQSIQALLGNKAILNRELAF